MRFLDDAPRVAGTERGMRGGDAGLRESGLMYSEFTQDRRSQFAILKSVEIVGEATQGRRLNGRTRWQAFQKGLPEDGKTNRTEKLKVRKAA